MRSMLNLDHIQRIYFIGIGGIGMSALARYFSFHGKKVSGYDRTETDLTKQLAREGIAINYDDAESLAPKDADLVVYTPAIPSSHEQLNYYRNNGYQLAKRSEVLGAITERSFNICVAGTHGKTTISTMIAHVLRHTGYGCNAFLGGIATNYNSNFWSSERNVCVVEADEYDRSFLRLSPDIAVITATDADHLDIYGDEQSVHDAFVQFAARIKDSGTLIAKKGLPIEDRIANAGTVFYSMNNKGVAIGARDVKIEQGSYRFDVQVKNELVENVVLNMGGMHNVENATVAVGVARLLGIDVPLIRSAIEAFRGVKRRFEYIVRGKNVVFIDDYAHHPAELAALIGSTKQLFPDKKCVVIFQPHLFSRTRDLATGFAESLDMAEIVLLLPIYPARELPIEGVTSEMISSRMKRAKAKLTNKSEVVQEVTDINTSNREMVLITAGAGDIDTLIQSIKQAIETSAT
jgi:UDP-N-acetylmuramate--alanine ligase